MSTHKNFDKICVVVLIVTLLLTILFMNGSRLGIETIIDEDSEANSQSVYFTTNDLNGTWTPLPPPSSVCRAARPRSPAAAPMF